MTQAELRGYAQRLDALNRKHAAAMQRRREEAQQEAHRLARRLYESLPGLKGVYGFGSLFVPGATFTDLSDIDLAIDGGELIEAVRICLHSPFRVDVVDITNPDDPISQDIRNNAARL
jgi:hypothetical protein